MRSWSRWLGLPVTAAGLLLAAAPPVQAAHDAGSTSGTTVFVQTNDPAGNAIDEFHRNADGTLAFVQSYATGGDGGREVGSMSDPLASQGSLVLVPDAGLLLAVNAGSDTISVFQVAGARLHLEQVLPSNGPFPTAFGVHGSLAYVLDAGGSGFVSGYRIADGRLHPIPGSTRALDLANAADPFFLSSPAEVGFTPSGGQLLVTTKTNGTVEVFAIGPSGRPSAAPTVNPEAGVPFAFVFDPAGELVLNFAGTGSLQTFTIDSAGILSAVGTPVSDGQAAACWITVADGFDYVSNTATSDVSQFQVASDGTVTLVNPVAASGVPGAIDSGAAGGLLYVQGGLDSAVHAFTIGAGGALSPVQVAAVPDGGSQEGIAIG